MGPIVLTDCGSVGFCSIGVAVLVYPEGVWYGQVQAEDVDPIVVRDELAGDVLDGIFEVLVKHRHVETGDRHLVADRPPCPLAARLDREIDPARRLILLPERRELQFPFVCRLCGQERDWRCWRKQ